MDDHIGDIIDSLTLCEDKVQLCLDSKYYIWDNELPQTIDEFNKKLLDSAEYAAFLIRAIIGNWEDVEIEQAGWEEKKITLCLADKNGENNIKEKIIQIRNDHDRLRGADLVARSSLILAWEICQKFENFYPCLDKADHPKVSQNESEKGKLSFRSSDFVRARKKDIDNGNNSPEDIRYNFDFESEDWQTFGWRTPNESDWFGGGSTEPKDKPESFLRFPAFYQYDASSNITFALSASGEKHQMSKLPLEPKGIDALRKKGICPYIKRKKEEFKSLLCKEPDYSITITTCLGIASYPGIHFKDKDFEAGYGVFITIDIAANKTLEVVTILNTVMFAQHRIRFIVTQALNSWLLEEEKKRADELKKYESMYKDLEQELEVLTDSMRASERAISNIRSTLYAPTDVFFNAKDDISELFDEGKVLTLFGEEVKIAHQPNQYKNDDDLYLVTAKALSILFGGMENENLGRGGAKGKLLEILEKIQTEKKKEGAAKQDLAQALEQMLRFEEYINIGYLICKLKNDKKRTFSNLLLNLKEQFFSLHKPDEATNVLMWKSLRGYLSSIKKLRKDKEVFRKIWNLSSDFYILSRNQNPLNIHGHLVEFIVQVVSQHYQYYQNKNLLQSICVHDEQNKDEYGMTIKSSKNWIETNQLGKMKEVICEGQKLRINQLKREGNLGDFHQLFATLVERIPRTILEEGFCCKKNNNSLTLQIEKLNIQFQKKKFSIIGDST